jgi:hypothetical protein
MPRKVPHAHVLNPWNFAVPTRAGPFVPYEPRHAPFNVVTDLGRLGPFGARRKPIPSDELLYADFQITPDYCVAGRLGAGRAGHYRGRYLKGVGRTPLAANWNHQSDQLHATGHLATSSAIREIVVTWVLEAKGLGHRINGCEGLLLAPLDAVLRDHQNELAKDDPNEAGLGSIGARAHLCDQTLQAITVKGSDFARLSNFVWLMNNMDLFTSRDALVHFLFLFTRYLDPTRPLALADISPTRIATEFAASIERTLAAFRDFFRAGVYWQFPQNNVTMDGRFQDLDFPIFVGGPLVGILAPDKGLKKASIPTMDPVRVIGLNVLGYLYQVRIFFKLLRARIALLPELDFSFTSSERDFISQLLVAFDEAIQPDHPIRNARAAARVLLGWYRDLCDVDSRAWPKLENLAAAAASWRLEQTFAGHAEFALTPFDVDWPRTGMTKADVLASFEGNAPRASDLEEARFLNRLILELDETNDRDKLFEKLRAAHEAIRERIRPLPA